MVQVLGVDPSAVAAITRSTNDAINPNHHNGEEDSQDNAKQDHSSRTSLTLSGSWDVTAITTVSEPPGNGIDVPILLQPLFGLDFLPFATPPPIPEEDPTTKEPELAVPPMVVEISSATEEEVPGIQPEDAFNEIPVHSIQRIAHQPALDPEETRELQELLQQADKKKNKKKKKRGFKAIVSIFQRKKKQHGKTLSVETAVPTSIEHLLLQTTNDGVSPTFTATTTTNEEALSPDSFNSRKAALATTIKQDEKLNNLQLQAHQQEECIHATQGEIHNLQSKLQASISRYQAQLQDFETTQKQLEEMIASQQQQQPPHTNESTSEQQSSSSTTNQQQRRVLRKSESGSFMRVHDLDLSPKSSTLSSSSSDPSLSSLSHSGHAAGVPQPEQPPMPTPDFLQMDQYLVEIVQQLIFVGYDLAFDEGDRYTPTRDTAKLITAASMERNRHGWPISPWTAALGEQILVWTGRVSHGGFGHTWPIVKGRVLLHTTPKNVLEYLWDSSMVPKYNPYCQGREDVYVLQDDVDMKASENPYGFTGCAKIVKSLNKHRLLPKGIEMSVLLYARPMEQHEGSYILVSRSVWENDKGTLDSAAAKQVIRTEMLMGCTIIRKLDDQSCELTQLTHVHLPGVPEMLARRTAPGQCFSLMKTLQAHFPPPSTSNA